MYTEYTPWRKTLAWIGLVSLFVIPFLLYEIHTLINATVQENNVIKATTCQPGDDPAFCGQAWR